MTFAVFRQAPPSIAALARPPEPVGPGAMAQRRALAQGSRPDADRRGGDRPAQDDDQASAADRDRSNLTGGQPDGPSQCPVADEAQPLRQPDGQGVDLAGGEPEAQRRVAASQPGEADTGQPRPGAPGSLAGEDSAAAAEREPGGDGRRLVTVLVGECRRRCPGRRAAAALKQGVLAGAERDREISDRPGGRLMIRCWGESVPLLVNLRSSPRFAMPIMACGASSCHRPPAARTSASLAWFHSCSESSRTPSRSKITAWGGWGLNRRPR